MSRRRWMLLAAAIGPALLLAVITPLHPTSNTADTALWWRNLHIILLPIFPLVALAPWLVAREVDRRLDWVTAIFGYVYACFYTSLDVLAGIGAGALAVRGFTDARSPLYATGRAFAVVGIVALTAATVIASAGVLRKAGWIAVPGALLAVAGSVLFYYGHVYFGLGTLAMLMLASGYAVLMLTVTRAPDGVAGGEQGH